MTKPKQARGDGSKRHTPYKRRIDTPRSDTDNDVEGETTVQLDTAAAAVPVDRAILSPTQHRCSAPSILGNIDAVLTLNNAALTSYKPKAERKQVLLNGLSLTPESLVDIGQGNVSLDLTLSAWSKIEAGCKVVQDVLHQNKVVYGVNTGFGEFSNVVIDSDKLEELQLNLIRSHAAGVGKPLPPERARMLLALRINVLSKGHSGVRPNTVKKLLDGFNAGVVSWVPMKGTVGASGDLAPLAHLALGFLGEGKMWNPTCGQWEAASEVLKNHNLEPLCLAPKEGLALINGTQFIASLGSEALVRARRAAMTADIIGAMSVEALRGTSVAFEACIHNARPHTGQIAVAQRLRALLQTEFKPSTLTKSHENCGKVQDSYTLRCIPQVHGVVHDTLDFVNTILTTELNSATDNPMVFADTGRLISGGNFHGEYPAKAMDYLAIGIHELANISERRIERFCNPTLSGLPAFLTENGGLNSGFMIAHCTAAALCSENKVLVHPSSADTLSTSAAKEDHVSMGGFAARKALQVVEHVETVLAIELLCATQALYLLRSEGNSTPPIEAVYSLVREHIEPWKKDRVMHVDIDKAIELVRSNKVIDVAAPHIEQYTKNAY